MDTTENSSPSEMQFAYSDISNHTTTLKTRENLSFEGKYRSFDQDRTAWEREDREFAEVRERIENPRPITDITKETHDEIETSVSTNGKHNKPTKPFQHTSAYYAEIENTTARLEAYRAIIATGNSAETEEEKEIREHPFAFLGLQENADFGQVRDAWRQQARLWHEDLMRPEDRARFNMIFGIKPKPKLSTEGNFPIQDIGAAEWLEELEKIIPPTKLEDEELAELNDSDRAAYEKAHADYRKKEKEYEAVKADMTRRAKEKMQLLQIAYKAASARFDKREIESVAGLRWNRGSKSGLDGLFTINFDYIYLEGGAELRRNTSHSFGNSDITSILDGSNISVNFDLGEIYMGDQADYRESINLQTLFVWIELIQLKNFPRSLLTGIAKKHSLDESKTEQLRMMLINREDILFILEALGIKEWKDQKDLSYFINTVYVGPSAFFQTGHEDGFGYSVGAEIPSDGSMIFKFHHQKHPGYSYASYPDQIHFTVTDMKLMRALAYGPMLAEEN